MMPGVNHAVLDAVMREREYLLRIARADADERLPSIRGRYLRDEIRSSMGGIISEYRATCRKMEKAHD